MNAIRLRKKRPAAIEIVGVIMVLWAFIAAIPAPSLFYKTLHSMGPLAGAGFFMVLFCLGSVLVACSWFEADEKFLTRTLFLSMMALAATFSLFAVKGVITPVTVTMPYLAVCCIRLACRDWKQW